MKIDISESLARAITPEQLARGLIETVARNTDVHGKRLLLMGEEHLPIMIDGRGPRPVEEYDASDYYVLDVRDLLLVYRDMVPYTFSERIIMDSFRSRVLRPLILSDRFEYVYVCREESACIIHN